TARSSSTAPFSAVPPTRRSPETRRRPESRPGGVSTSWRPRHGPSARLAESTEHDVRLLVHPHAGVAAPQLAELDETAILEGRHPCGMEKPFMGIEPRRIDEELACEADGRHWPVKLVDRPECGPPSVEQRDHARCVAPRGRDPLPEVAGGLRVAAGGEGHRA